jgi:hypothetical protein
MINSEMHDRLGQPSCKGILDHFSDSFAPELVMRCRPEPGGDDSSERTERYRYASVATGFRGELRVDDNGSSSTRPLAGTFTTRSPDGRHTVADIETVAGQTGWEPIGEDGSVPGNKTTGRNS